MELRTIIQIEFGFLGFSAASLAIIFILAVSYGVSFQYFDRLWAFDWGSGIINLLGVGLISILTAVAATWRTLRENRSHSCSRADRRNRTVQRSAPSFSRSRALSRAMAAMSPKAVASSRSASVKSTGLLASPINPRV